MESSASYTSPGTSADSSPSLPAAAESTPTTPTETVTPETLPAAAADGADVEVQPEVEGETTEVEGEPEKKGHQKTLEERAEEIADRKIQQRLAEAEQRQQAAQAERPDFIPVDYNAYDSHIAKLAIQERQLQDELTLDPENPVAIVRQLRAVQRERFNLEQSFEANEQKRAAWEGKQQQTEKEKAFFAQTQAEIDRAVLDIPRSRGITDEVLQAGRQFITESFTKDPALQRKFDDLISHRTMYQGFSGVQAAVDWAITYAESNMGKAAEASRAKREGGKGLNPGSSGGNGDRSSAGINSFSDLMAMSSEKVNQFVKDHPQRFENLKKQHFK